MSTQCIMCGVHVSDAFETEFQNEFQKLLSEAAAGYNPMSIQYAAIPSELEERERYRRSYECRACRQKRR